MFFKCGLMHKNCEIGQCRDYRPYLGTGMNIHALAGEQEAFLQRNCDCLPSTLQAAFLHREGEQMEAGARDTSVSVKAGHVLSGFRPCMSPLKAAAGPPWTSLDLSQPFGSGLPQDFLWTPFLDTVSFM